MMDQESLVALLQDEERLAASYRSTELADQQKTAIDYYEANPFGDEEEGRSQVVSPDVQEVVDYMTISILRACVSGDRVVEFEAKEAEDVEAATEATEAVNYIFMRGQDGYKVLNDWLQSGLVEKIGVVKTSVMKDTKRHRERLVDVSEDVLASLMDEPGIKVLAVTPDNDGQDSDEQQPMQPGMQPPATYIVDVESQKPRTRFVDMPIPSEEFLFSSRMRDVDDIGYKCHKTLKTKSELIEMGFDRDTIEGLPLTFSQISYDIRHTTRWSDEGLIPQTAVPGLEKVWLREEYLNIDLNDDGVAELVQVFRVENVILDIQEVEENPFVVFTPFPRAHRMVGNSLADKVMDIQRIRSVIMRQTLDGIYLTNNPRTWLPDECQNENTIDDLLTVRPGGIVRGKGAGGRPEPLYEPFQAQSGLAMLELMTGERESRTGITRLNQGLDADALNKMLCIETPVPLADGGYKRLGDIQDDDWIIGADGSPVLVIKAHKIHDPERAYRITFASGDVIDSGGEHLWTVQTDNDKRYNKSQTVDTDRLFDMMQGKGRVYVPRVERPKAGFERELPLDPYMLGTWLGDGHSYCPRITTMELETVEYAQSWAGEFGGLTVDKHQNSGAATSYYVKGLYPILRQMKLLKRGDTAKDADIIGKHIPEEYFGASYRQRLELLRGLMDTDGCHHSNALCVFVQKGGRLLDDVVRLIESLGGWPSVRPASAEGAFQVTFSLADCPFKLARKVKDWTAPVANATTQVIKGIERIAVKPMRCLTVDAEDGLFCVGKRFTVTHNTATGTALMQAQGQQQEEYIARNFAEAMARLFLKKLRLMIAAGDPVAVKIEGGFKTVDPTNWSDDLDVSIRVGLGSGRKDQRLLYRNQLLQYQQLALQAGLINPMHLYRNISGWIRDASLGTPTDYWQDPSEPGYQPPQPQPDPKAMALQQKAQIEQGKVQIAAQSAQSDAQIQQQKLMLQAQQGAAKIQADQDKASMQASLEIRRQELEAQLERENQAIALAGHVIKANRPGGALDA